jgi:YHS domain-containing protein
MRIIITLFVTLMLTNPVWSQSAATRQKQLNLEKGVAIEGYDPVSYFQGKPKEGSDKYSYIYNGVTYHFATAQNLATFKTNAAAYEPQYGGWCAYAMGAKGQKVEVDPETFKIVGGKLYLFYNKYLNNTRDSWNKDEKHLMSVADENWKKIFHP